MRLTLLAAAITPDNTPHGYNLTFAFPMLMFIIIAGALFLRFRGAHRVPGHVALASSRWAAPGSTTSSSTLHEDTARSDTGSEGTDAPAAESAGESTDESADESTEGSE